MSVEEKITAYIKEGLYSKIDQLCSDDAKYINGLHLKEAIRLDYEFSLTSLLDRMENPPIIDPGYIAYAASTCSLKALKALRKYKFAWDHTAYIEAAMSSQLAILKYLVADKCPGGDFTKQIAEIKDTAITDILLSVHCIAPKEETLDLKTIIGCGHWTFFYETVHKRSSEITGDHLMYAISRGLDETAKVLAHIVIKNTVLTCDYIDMAAAKDMCILIGYLRKIGFPFSSNTYHSAAINGKIRALKQLYKLNCPVDDFRNLADVIKSKYLECSEYLLSISSHSEGETECNVQSTTVQPTDCKVQPTTVLHHTTTHPTTLEEFLENRVKDYSITHSSPVHTNLTINAETTGFDKERSFDIAFDAYRFGIIPYEYIDTLGDKLASGINYREFARLKFLFSVHMHLKKI